MVFVSMIRVRFPQAARASAWEFLMFNIAGDIGSHVMSFPEGPQKMEQLDDSHDTVDPAPTDGVFGAVRRHLRTWADRYVEMRVEARTNPRE